MPALLLSVGWKLTAGAGQVNDTVNVDLAAERLDQVSNRSSNHALEIGIGVKS